MFFLLLVLCHVYFFIKANKFLKSKVKILYTLCELKLSKSFLFVGDAATEIAGYLENLETSVHKPDGGIMVGTETLINFSRNQISFFSQGSSKQKRNL